MPRPAPPDITGQRFGRWLVTARAVERNRYWCRCDCGVTRTVDYYGLRSGTSRSCGCFSKHQAMERMTGNRHAAGHKGRWGDHVGYKRRLARLEETVKALTAKLESRE